MKISMKATEENQNRDQQNDQNFNAFFINMCGKCYSYGKPGHKQNECTEESTPPKGQGRGRSYNRDHQRGRGKYHRGLPNQSQHRGRRRSCNNRGSQKSPWFNQE